MYIQSDLCMVTNINYSINLWPIIMLMHRESQLITITLLYKGIFFNLITMPNRLIL